MYEITEPERDFAENVRFRLKKLALEATKEGTLEKFAELIEKHPTTVSGWMTAGDVPDFQARRIEKRFGRDKIKAEELSLKLAKNDDSGTILAENAPINE